MLHCGSSSDTRNSYWSSDSGLQNEFRMSEVLTQNPKTSSACWYSTLNPNRNSKTYPNRNWFCSSTLGTRFGVPTLRESLNVVMARYIASYRISRRLMMRYAFNIANHDIESVSHRSLLVGKEVIVSTLGTRTEVPTLVTPIRVPSVGTQTTSLMLLFEMQGERISYACHITIDWIGLRLLVIPILALVYFTNITL